MSELSNKPVENGERLKIASSFFNGMAGVRSSEFGGEFACIAEYAILRDRKATVGGRSARVIDLRKSGTASA